MKKGCSEIFIYRHLLRKEAFHATHYRYALNIVVVPGTKALPDLLSDTGRGVIVRGFIGGNSNDVTGDFSLGIYGSFIENGKISHAVSGMNISGNQKDLWGRLVALGGDVYTYSSVRSPSLLFDGVQFTGNDLKHAGLTQTPQAKCFF